MENLLGTNLRVRERVQVSIPGIAVLDEIEYPVTIHNISSDGAFIEIKQTPIRGDLIELSFSLPDQDRKVHIRAAAVVWCGVPEDGIPEGAGIYFLTIDQETKRQISIFVQKLTALSPGSYNGNAAVGDGAG